MIFAYFGHAWLLFYSMRHPLIALAILGVLMVTTGIRTLIKGSVKWCREWQVERSQKAEAGHAFAVYLGQREEMHQAEAKARELKERFAGEDIAGTVNVIFDATGHPKLNIKLEHPQDRARANKIAADCVRA